MGPWSLCVAGFPFSFFPPSLHNSMLCSVGVCKARGYFLLLCGFLVLRSCCDHELLEPSPHYEKRKGMHKNIFLFRRLLRAFFLLLYVSHSSRGDGLWEQVPRGGNTSQWLFCGTWSEGRHSVVRIVKKAGSLEVQNIRTYAPQESGDPSDAPRVIPEFQELIGCPFARTRTCRLCFWDARTGTWTTLRKGTRTSIS